MSLFQTANVGKTSKTTVHSTPPKAAAPTVTQSLATGTVVVNPVTAGTGTIRLPIPQAASMKHGLTSASPLDNKLATVSLGDFCHTRNHLVVCIFINTLTLISVFFSFKFVKKYIHVYHLMYT